MSHDLIAQRVRLLAEAFAATELLRLTLSDSGFELELRRSAVPPPVNRPALPDAAPVDAAAGAPQLRKPDIVSSDLVGVVRFSRPPVGEGYQLETDRELAFVEALGIRNPVRSRGAGRVTGIFVSDGQPVEFGQPLFAIDR